MLSFAHAMASDLVSCTMPPLLAPYTGAKLAPKIDIIDPMLMILPPPACLRCGYAALAHRNALVKLVFITVCHSSSASASTGLRMLIPALFTTISMRPQRCAVWATSASTECALVTSTSIASASLPILFNSRTALADLSALRPATTTRAPARASPFAMPNPMPPLPPVTMATFPFKSNMRCSSLRLFLQHDHFEIVRGQHQRVIVG